VTIGIRWLAERLEVSIGTVSRALNDRPGVHPDTKARVLRAASEWGYVANAPARSLRRGTTSTIGLVIETDNAAAREGDNFFLAIADAMQDVLARKGYDLVLLPTRRSGQPLDMLQHIVRRGTVDALILTATRGTIPASTCSSALGCRSSPWVARRRRAPTLDRSRLRGGRD
jgi:DNA-binding LacI/PurR family transcriptional regulator